MGLEEDSLEPVIEHVCAECGARLTRSEIATSLESAGPALCTTHASEQVPLDEIDEQ